MKEQLKLSSLKGIGEKTELLFQKVGVYSIADLIRYYPKGYDVYEEPITIAEIEEGRTVTITGTILGRAQLSGNRNMQITTIRVKDLTGTLKVIWFRMPFLKNTLSSGSVVTVRGRIVHKRDGNVMEHPELFYPSSKYAEKCNTLQPQYSLVAGLTNNAIKKAMLQAIQCIDLNNDILPQELQIKYALTEYENALNGIHFPVEKEQFYVARERFVFEEFLVFLLSLRKIKHRKEREKNRFGFHEISAMDSFIQELPYELTNAQKQVWKDIKNDITGPHVMSRLVQGDVGSGKTIVALLGLMYVGLNGYQGAMMAPTEVLAKQHYDTIQGMLTRYRVPLQIGLLTGSMTAKEKRHVQEQIATGQVQIIVGTHALIQEKALYQNLALVVTDEQHRFGVKQREALSNKGIMPHILVMSATPIPRTLAIILYGDLDISVIDELPKNRLPIKNCVVDTGYRNTAYQFMKKQIEEGRQCYVICSMVEESEHLEVENVTDYTETLREILGENVTISCLHGKMKQVEKDEIMMAFSRKEIDILVSTTVIEVGIDVPNSTVMLIENAERFGLAQLHQLRGRVGRGEHQSYCIFMSASKSKETKERLAILNSSNDGFFVASEDLRLRGPGDLFGIRQSGLLDFKLGDVFQDAKVLQRANEAVAEILAEDPELEKEKYSKLKSHLEQYLSAVMLETTL